MRGCSSICFESMLWGRVSGVGPARWRRWLDEFGSVAAILAANDESLASAIGVREVDVRRWRSGRSSRPLRCEVARLVRAGGWCRSLGCVEFPPLWKGMVDPPIAVQGFGDTAAMCTHPVVAIVGARRASPMGLDLAAQFAGAFVEAGWTVCSGGARGIDSAAHRAVLRQGGRTGVILGSGLGRIYPPEHESLFRRIVETGGFLVSELPFDQPPRPSQFPVRNRLVAGMAVGVVVIEAGIRSGALITARLAAEDYGREVVALPGRADLEANRGGHLAIREGWAMLVDRPVQAVEAFEAQRGLRGLVSPMGA